MQKFFENVFYGVGINDVIDILIVAFVIYKLLGLIKQTRAEQLMKGVVLLVIATFLSGLLNLHTINWLLKGTVRSCDTCSVPAGAQTCAGVHGQEQDS